MNASVDVFRLDERGPLWLVCVDSVERAKICVQELAANAPGEYLILDRTTGSKYVLKVDGAQRPELTLTTEKFRWTDVA
jgi:hypothetical protein